MNIAALQLPTLPLSDSKLDYYMRICVDREIKLLVLGEYVLNHFFKELENTPLSMIKEQSQHQLGSLKKFAKEYGITMVAPIIRVEKKQPYKCIVRVTPSGSVSYFYQQILISYEHWNEAGFFANESKQIETPPTFTLDGIKFGVIFGFELHFDLIWLYLKQKNVDVVLMPTVSTFDSQLRWREIIKTRAFCNGMYILRANRIGEYPDEDKTWKFYGDSLWVSPAGEIESALGSDEELMVASIDKKFIRDTRKLWGFKAPEAIL